MKTTTKHYLYPMGVEKTVMVGEKPTEQEWLKQFNQDYRLYLSYANNCFECGFGFNESLEQCRAMFVGIEEETIFKIVSMAQKDFSKKNWE